YLSVTASPDSGKIGDSVTFTASTTSGSITVRRWVWVPDVDSTGQPYFGNPQTIACSHTLTTCKVAVYEPGTMYVVAKTGSGTLARGETAGAHVQVAFCLTGDEVLDFPVTRKFLVELVRLSDKFTPAKEVRGYVFQMPDNSYTF